MSSYLALCQKVDTLIGSQGAISSVTTGGYQGMLATYVKNAWLNIQALRPDWHFLRTKVTFNLTTSSQKYSVLNVFPSSLGVDPVGSFIVDRFLNSDGDKLTYIPYNQWILGDYSTASAPRVFTIHPSSLTGYLSFNAVDTTYPITAHYFRKPQELTLATDTPLCPSEYHDAIVFTAAADLGAFLGNSDIYSNFSVRADHMVGSLMRSQNPSKRVRARSAC